MEKMFCFQCEQTVAGKGCTGCAGACGKQASTSLYQDKLTEALILLAHAANGRDTDEKTDQLMMEGLFTTVTNVNFDDESIQEMTREVLAECGRLQADARNAVKQDVLNADRIWHGDEDIRSLKSLVLFGVRGMAAYAYHALLLGHTDSEVNQFFYESLREVGNPSAGQEALLALAMETGRVNLKCMELLDKANTEAYGVPSPATVPLTIEKGPFIVVSGHDLHDLKLLLEQTEGKGVQVYTHGEMLPAHAYPELRKHAHLKGNFGTAWQNQQKEFHQLPASVLFTTNCIMPVKESYRDRVYTTAVVRYPGMQHVGDEKDFSPLIAQAIALGGYKEDQVMTGINGGTEVVTGYGHGTVLSVADQVVEAVKRGEISHFLLVGGCDGAKPGRNYYTELVKQAPEDTVILTLACGKYRFNDLELGTVAGLPRLMDMGQCNDAYSAIRVAVALAEAFACGVNDLPLSLVLSWYEQKAVSILLTLLYLGIRNIFIGPSIPAFLSANVLEHLVKEYGIRSVTEPQEDLKAILGK